MKRIILVILSVMLGGTLFANHWHTNPHQFPTNMNVIGIIEINGIEQTTESLELGAFFGEECRGSQMLQYYDVLDRYLVFLTLHGEYGNTFTFKLYDHQIQQELDLESLQTIMFVSDAIIGSIGSPYVFAFSGGGSYSVTTAASPEAGGMVSGGGTFFMGETCTVSATANAGYFFTEWRENDTTVSTESEFRFAVTANRTLTACFELSTYTIEARPEPDTAGTVTGTGTYFENQTCVLTATPNEGYTFESWTEEGVVVWTEPEYSFAVTSDRFLIANFMLNSYDITAESQPDEGGSIMGTGQYDYGSIATLSALPNATYYFINWTENGEVVSTQSDYSFLVTGDRHLVATFAQSCFVVDADVEPSEGGYVVGTGNYVEGSICHLEAHPANGYTFVSWTENGLEVSTQSEFSFVVESDRRLVAHFEIGYFEITAIADPENGGAVEGMGFYTYGETAKLVAVPKENYVFCNWTENGNVVSDHSDYVFTVVGNRQLVAHFAYYDEVVGREVQCSVFPNPTEGKVRIQGLPQCDISVFDAGGKLLFSEKNVSGEHNLDLSGFPSGWYLLKIQSPQGSYCQKIFKK